jgi:ribose-phosphate pyrophosphokinase
MFLVPGSSSPSLALKLASEMDCEVAQTKTATFPDGERYVRLMEPVDEAVVVQNTNPDGNLVELFLWADALREAGASWVAAVVPYMGYTRQDKIFQPGEPLSIRAVARRLQVDLDCLVTVDLHNPAVLEHFDIPAKAVSGGPAIARHLEGRIDRVLSPDEGGKEGARAVAEILDCPWDFLEKTRLDAHRVVMRPKSLEVEGKAVAIVDDVISTGGTIAAATEALREHGASRVIAACTHGRFVEGALERLKACDEVFSTDTIENSAARTSVAREVAQAVKDLR